MFILLPVHNRAAVTERLVFQLERQSHRDFEVILIDDGCTDGTAERVRRLLGDRVHCLRGDGNLWWAGALQRGLDYLAERNIPSDSVICFMNDDIFIDDDFLSIGARHVASSGPALFAAREYAESTGEMMSCGVELDWETWRFDFRAPPASVNCLSSRAMFMSWNTARIVGGFHPRLLPHYLSDYEFAQRAKRRAVRLVVPEDLAVVVDTNTTGTHRLAPGQPLRDFLRIMFSRRTATNPIWTSSFILLACPPRFIPRNLWRVWRGFAQSLVKTVGSEETTHG